MTATVIVGASVGGVRTAQALRAAGYDGAITLIEAEAAAPYDRPPLSKGFLAGTRTADSIRLLTEAQLRGLELDLRLGQPAVGVDIAAATVSLGDGATVGYDSLVIATGARARPAPWRVEGRVFVLRSQDDCLRIRAALRPGLRLVVVGGGFIGSEVATTARDLGLTVTVADPFLAPLSRVVGDEVGQRLAGLAAAYGVHTRYGAGVERVVAAGDAVSVELTTGEFLPADVVVVGIGAVPNDEWLAASGLSLDDGVLCDEFGQVVGTRSVYAVGDVARWLSRHDGAHRRVEHWTNTVDQAACVGHNIANPNDQTSHQSTDYVWSDQYGVALQFAGSTRAEFRQTWLNDPTNPNRWVVFYADHDAVLRGAVTVDWPRAMVMCRRAIAGAKPVEEVSSSLSRTFI